MLGLLGGLGGLISGVGNLVSSQYTAAADTLLAGGDFTAGQAYGVASNIGSQNAQIEEMATGIQEAQLNRKIYSTVSGQAAETGHANVSGGSAGDLMRMSISQGNLARTLASTQGEISANAFREQSTAYAGMQGQANAAGAAALQNANATQTSGIFGLFGGIAKFIGGLF